ncbi:hypothetical protein V492_00822 [Pseudogymnoascus sp. VKM F-4246]|nr:hypothetical protein V492_00822 [Pseudogymnoascus sp. VKM F-4246]
MSETTGNTTEKRDDSTSTPDSVSGMTIHQVLSEVDQYIHEAQQDAAELTKNASKLYELASQLEATATPYTKLAASFRESGDVSAHGANSIVRVVDKLKQIITQFRECSDLTHYKKCHLDVVNTVTEAIEKYRSDKRDRILLGDQEELEQQFKELEWLIVVDGIVRPTNKDD